MTRSIDLHTHSRASDGSDSPTELARKVAAAGLAAFALTDHDSLDGLDEAAAESARLGLEFIPGVEIAVRHDYDELHLLGLWLVNPSAALHEGLELFRKGRDERNRAILDKLARLNAPLNMAEVLALAKGRTVGRPHIAMALKNRGYVYSRQEAFDRYLGWGAKAFVPRCLPSPEEGIALLAAEGAIVVLAHPCLSPVMSGQRLDALLGDLHSMGLNAIEAWHSSHDPNQTRLCLDLAERHGLLCTGGSDYHGANKQDIALGSGRGNMRVPYKILEILRAHRTNLGKR
ncbi:PHP domain-containing protein [Desulfovibrio sp. OttesenSCG-928-M16]|nr:PHP domain-containing protein [Desulfovibrio sp. OttesenSCG-928-M16]